MNSDMAEIYCNMYHYACRMCDGTFSRDEVRDIKNGDCIEFICNQCHSDEINVNENKGE